MARKIGGHVSTSGGLLNSIKNTKNIGGNCMQIFAGSPRSWARTDYDPEVAAKFKAMVKSENLGPVFVHALYLINLAAETEGTLNNSMTALESELRNSVSIGAAGVILHIGSYTTRDFETVADDLIRRINLLLKGNTEAVLILENSAGQKGKIGTLDQLGYLVKELNNERVKICLDTAHLFAAGYDITNEKGLSQVVDGIVKNNLADKLACLHLNDSATPCDSRRDIHENLGKGKIGLPGLKALVNHDLFKELPIILEVPGDEKSKTNGPDITNINVAISLTN